MWKQGCLLAAAMTVAVSASAGPTATPEFDLLWPALPKPYYFMTNFAQGLTSVAVDDEDFVYVAERLASKILKYSADGVLVSTIGGADTNADDFISQPRGVTVDSDGNLYIVEVTRSQLTKMDPEGNVLYLHSAELNGSGDGQFGATTLPILVAVDPSGAAYVADRANHRVQKFTPEGQFDRAFGTLGTGDGQFGSGGPTGIVWANDQLYVADFSNSRLLTFDAMGNFQTEIDGLGTGINGVLAPVGLAADDQGRIYVGSQGVQIVQLDAVGNELTRFGAPTRIPPGVGLGDNEIAGPLDVAVNSSGGVYALDRYGVVRFAPDTSFLARWGSAGYDPGQFIDPDGLDIDSQDRIFVVDSFNERVQIFDSDGIFISSWSPNFIPGEFFGDLTIAPDDTVYITVGSNSDIVRRFQTDGTLISSFGVADDADPGVGANGIFAAINDIAIDASGNLYVLDPTRSEIQTFDSAHTYLATFGVAGSSPSDLTVSTDGSGDLLVADLFDNQVRRYDNAGNFITSHTVNGGQRAIGTGAAGRFYVIYHDTGAPRMEAFDATGASAGLIAVTGTFAGQMGFGAALAESSDGRLYALDSTNNRVQRFRAPVPVGDSRAIVLAGGGPFPGNTLWPATQANANFVVRTLVGQGFPPDSIHYLSADTDLDLDGNGLADDVDADATNSNFLDAITGAFATGADSLLLYLVDHGGLDDFRMSGTEILAASELDAALDTWQAAHPSNPVTIIYDACQSGSFIDDLAGPDRLVIASARPEEPAYFVSQGTMSFSNHFWTEVFNGEDVRTAFDAATVAVNSGFTTQTPQIDADGDALANEPEDLTAVEGVIIGRGVGLLTDRPVIANVTAPAVIPSGNSATLTATGVFDTDGISRVWAVLQPPGYEPGSADNAINELPQVEFSPVDDIGTWSADYDQFNEAGTYVATVYAQDVPGNRGMPLQVSISVDDPLLRRAIIVVGPEDGGSRRPLFERFGRLAYGALAQQGYGPNNTTCTNAACDDVQFLSTAAGVGFDAAPSLSNLQDAIVNWGSNGVRDLTLFLVGAQDSAGDFVISGTETLSAAQLDTWLAQAEAAIPGQLTVIYDGDDSGAFVPTLASQGVAPRIVVTATDAVEPALLSDTGRIGYSSFFWTAILNGASVNNAHLQAATSVRAASSALPQIEDQGNGVANELLDGLLAARYRLGNGILLAGDAPVIGGLTVADALVLDREPIIADPVTSTATVASVIALITRPNGERVPEPLTLTGSWSADSVGLCGPAGDYTVAAVALDDAGTASAAVAETVNRASPCADTGFDLGVTDVEGNTLVLTTETDLPFTISALNLGAQTVPSAQVTGYLSLDPTIDTGDQNLGTVNVNDLISLNPRVATFVAPSPMVETTVYLGACVESLPGDTDAGNDCSAGLAVRIFTTFEIFTDGFE